MFNSLMPSLNIRSLPFVGFMGGFPSRLQNLSSGAIRPGGLLFNLHVRKLSNGPMNLSWCQFCTFSHANAIMSHTVSHVLVIWLLFCSFDVIHSVFYEIDNWRVLWQLFGTRWPAKSLRFDRHLCSADKFAVVLQKWKTSFINE